MKFSKNHVEKKTSNIYQHYQYYRFLLFNKFEVYKQ